MAEKPIGRGQYTIVKLHDGKSMQLNLLCNHHHVQYFSRLDHSFSPNYVVDPIVVTPELLFSGATDNQISNISSPEWTINGKKPIEYSGVVSSSLPYTLTINKNLIDTAQLKIEFSGMVKDPDTGLNVKISGSTCFTKQETDNLTPTMILETPDGNFFKNEIFDKLTATCKLMLGSEELTLSTKRKWFCMENGNYVELVDNSYVQGQGTNTLTVCSDYTTDQTSFKCEIEYNKATYTEFVTFFKQVDPYIIKIEMKNGDKMKNGAGVIPCEAHLYRSDVQIPDEEAEKKFIFQWKKYSKLTGQEVTTWRNPAARAIELTKTDIDKLSTFMCEVKEKNNTFTYKLPLKLL